MDSTIKVKTLGTVDEGTSFTDIFSNIVLGYAETKSLMSYSHASLVPYATAFFKKKTDVTTSPVKVIEKALAGSSPFIPGSSFVSIPWENFLNLYYADQPQQRGSRLVPLSYRGKLIDASENGLYELKGRHRTLEQLMSSRILIKNESVEVGMNNFDYDRAFAQVLVGALEASVQLGNENVLRIPSFANREPNYFDDVSLDYVGEGLQNGTLFVEGNVGALCGKHAEGGNIVITGTARNHLGDCARNVNFYIGGQNEKVRSGKFIYSSITQAKDCSFLINHILWGVISADNCKIDMVGFAHDDSRGLTSYSREETMIAKGKLTERGNTINESFDGFEQQYQDFVASLK